MAHIVVALAKEPVGLPVKTVNDCVVVILFPQALLAVTVKFPVPGDEKEFTVIELVPCPDQLLTIAGTVQV